MQAAEKTERCRRMRLGALEAGGTKMVCAIGNESGEIFERISIPTLSPETTIPRMVEFFKNHALDGLGIASFGPVELDERNPRYGSILETNKVNWRGFNIREAFVKALGCPVGFDTDVNGSVLGEVTFGQAKGKECVLYLTIGTGVGAGICIGGRLLHGMLHPEAGHVLITKQPQDTFAGNCCYHRNCLEGLAAGPAIEQRWGRKAEELADRAEVWELEADYIAQALVGYIMTISPNMLILGGGVMHQEQLFSLIRRKVTEYVGGYLKTEELQDMENYIVPASLQDDQGIMGCLELARRAVQAG